MGVAELMHIFSTSNSMMYYDNCDDHRLLQVHIKVSPNEALHVHNMIRSNQGTLREGPVITYMIIAFRP